MRVDREGRLLQQLTIFLPAEMVQLLKADGLNVSQFIREQVALLYDIQNTSPNNNRDKLILAAQASLARHREAAAEREAEVERARTVVRQMRAERETAKARQEGITDALLQIVGDGPADRYRRMLPENDLDGDRVDDWDALVRRVSRLCGAEIDSAEVAAGLRRLLAKA